MPSKWSVNCSNSRGSRRSCRDPVRLPDDFLVTAETEDGVIMAFEHRREPIAAVQFHPESIMTLGQNAGMRMIENIVAHLPRKAKEKAA